MNILAITGPAALIVVIVVIILAAFPVILYLIMLQRLLKEISPENRKMQPEQVWLSLIPIFGIVWQFFIVGRMADSVALEYQKRNIYPDERRPGYNMGILYCILLSAAIIPYLGFLSFVGGVVCWVLYWLKIIGYRDKLRQNPLNYINI